MKLPGLQIGNRRAETCIIQGGMSVRIALAPLAAAVAEQGGVGTIGGMGISPPELRAQIREARTRTDGIIGVNLMYVGYLFDRLLEVCIEENIDYVAIGAGFARGPFKKLNEHEIPGFAIISSAKAARIVVRTPGVTGVVVESGRAGGHLGPKNPELSTWELFPEVLKQLQKVEFAGPVVAAGGLLTKEDISRVLGMGADGVQLGTRFAVSDESSASDAMKKKWMGAVGSQVEWWSPTGYPLRAIVPHDDEQLPRLNSADECRRCLKLCTHRDDLSSSHCILRALENAQEGDVENGLILAGARVSEIDELLSVEKIFERLVADNGEAEGETVEAEAAGN